MRWQIVKGSSYLPVKTNLGVVILGSSGSCEVTIDLVREGVQALILGLVAVGGSNSLDLSVITIHRAANTHAETIIHGLVRDRGQALIKGLIKINKRAQRVTDFLTERILLLSPDARAVAEPELEIEADEVRASHAATVSSLDKTELFYLMSRGVDRGQAEKLITDGFLNHVLNRIDNDKIRNQVCSMLKR